MKTFFARRASFAPFVTVSTAQASGRFAGSGFGFLVGIFAAAFSLSVLAAGKPAAHSPEAGNGEIIIGQVAAFSGPLAPTGSQLHAGARLYFDAVNAGGGINGARLKLVTRDDGYRSEDTVRLVRELLREVKPLALFGVVGTGNVLALIDEKVLDQAAVPLVTVRSGAASVVARNHPYVFLTRASYAEEVQKIVEQYASTGTQNFALFYQDDAFGRDVLPAAEAAIKRAGGTVVARGAYEKNTTHVENAVKAIAAANPQTVIMISNTAASAEFLRQSRAAGNTAQYVALSVTDAAQVVKLIGVETAHGLALTQVVPSPDSRSTPLGKEIQENFRKFAAKDALLNETFAEGYLGGKVLVEALRRSGPNPSPRKLRDALDSLHSWDAGGVVIDFAPTRHLGSHYVDITILNRQGKLLR
ncbi:ABC transporter substrate-binding protein [Rhodocyclus tenuis]|uniref:ABC transporter substrate-binding protein n=1 Tax=Rhodocyclus tenuis TaxID=1066 RepID=UPI001905DC16